MITLFLKTFDTMNPNYIEVQDAYERIRKCVDMHPVNLIRAETDKKKRAALKVFLPCYIFSGQFTARDDKAITAHSGRCVLDFDKLPDLEEKRAKIASYSFVEACFISPSGNGLKAIVKIPANIEKHRWHYQALLDVFPDADGTSINESRICYASYDKNIYVNMLATVFEEQSEPKSKKPDAHKPIYASAPVTSTNSTNYSKLDISVRMIMQSLDGHKHEVLLKASKLAGGYIASGVVQEDEAIRVLELAISNREIDDFAQAQKTIRDGIEYGRIAPLFETERECGIVPTITGIKPVDAAWETMKHQFVHGKKRGETTHFKKFDENFKWKKGEITLLIARPNYGKTEFALQLMLAKSAMDGWKWGVFSPENYPEDEFYDTLIHAYIGKTTDPYYGDAQMSMTEYEKGYNFIKQHFFYVYPERHTIDELDANFLHLIEKEKINGTFLDPFNQIEAEYGQRQDMFLSKFLTDRKKLAIKYQTCDIISTHPKTMSRNKNGTYEIPDIYDIWGGSMWGNKMDNIMALDRPNIITDPMDTAVDVHVKKIKKQRLVGIPGVCRFDFKRKTNRYYIDGVNPMEEPKEEPKRISEPRNNGWKKSVNNNGFYEANNGDEPF